MNLNIKIEIKLGEAKVELSQNQLEQVKGFVENILNSSKVNKVRSGRTRQRPVLGSRTWTAQEDSELEQFMETVGNGANRRLAIRTFAQKVGRTPKAVQVRMYYKKNPLTKTI